MRPRQKFTEAQKIEIRKFLKSAKTKEEFQRAQAIMLRMELGLHASEIAKILGLHTASIWKIHARFFREGSSILKSKPHGGRYRENLPVCEEQKLLKPFLRESKRSGILIVSEIKKAYEQVFGHEVPPSTVYRMLNRNGWRKIVPRPNHPKSDAVAQEAFKKTLQNL